MTESCRVHRYAFMGKDGLLTCRGEEGDEKCWAPPEPHDLQVSNDNNKKTYRLISLNLQEMEELDYFKPKLENISNCIEIDAKKYEASKDRKKMIGQSIARFEDKYKELFCMYQHYQDLQKSDIPERVKTFDTLCKQMALLLKDKHYNHVLTLFYEHGQQADEPNAFFTLFSSLQKDLEAGVANNKDNYPIADQHTGVRRKAYELGNMLKDNALESIRRATSVMQDPKGRTTTLQTANSQISTSIKFSEMLRWLGCDDDSRSVEEELEKTQRIHERQESFMPTHLFVQEVLGRTVKGAYPVSGQTAIPNSSADRQLSAENSLSSSTIVQRIEMIGNPTAHALLPAGSSSIQVPDAQRQVAALVKARNKVKQSEQMMKAFDRIRCGYRSGETLRNRYMAAFVHHGQMDEEDAEKLFNEMMEYFGPNPDIASMEASNEVSSTNDYVQMAKLALPQYEQVVEDLTSRCNLTAEELCEARKKLEEKKEEHRNVNQELLSQINTLKARLKSTEVTLNCALQSEPVESSGRILSMADCMRLLRQKMPPKLLRIPEFVATGTPDIAQVTAVFQQPGEKNELVVNGLKCKDLICASYRDLVVPIMGEALFDFHDEFLEIDNKVRLYDKGRVLIDDHTGRPFVQRTTGEMLDIVELCPPDDKFAVPLFPGIKPGSVWRGANANRLPARVGAKVRHSSGTIMNVPLPFSVVSGSEYESLHQALLEKPCDPKWMAEFQVSIEGRRKDDEALLRAHETTNTEALAKEIEDRLVRKLPVHLKHFAFPPWCTLNHQVVNCVFASYGDNSRDVKITVNMEQLDHLPQHQDCLEQMYQHLEMMRQQVVIATAEKYKTAMQLEADRLERDREEMEVRNDVLHGDATIDQMRVYKLVIGKGVTVDINGTPRKTEFNSSGSKQHKIDKEKTTLVATVRNLCIKFSMAELERGCYGEMVKDAIKCFESQLAANEKKQMELDEEKRALAIQHLDESLEGMGLEYMRVSNSEEDRGKVEEDDLLLSVSLVFGDKSKLASEKNLLWQTVRILMPYWKLKDYVTNSQLDLAEYRKGADIAVQLYKEKPQHLKEAREHFRAECGLDKRPSGGKRKRDK